MGLCLCSAPFNLLKGKARTSETKTLEATMGDRDMGGRDMGGRDGGEDRGPGLDTTLQDSDIESNWDQVRGPAVQRKGCWAGAIGQLRSIAALILTCSIRR